MNLNLTSIPWRPTALNGKLDSFRGRGWFCCECGDEFTRGEEQGRFSNLEWSSKGYDCGVETTCVACGASIDEGIEVWFFVQVS